MNCPRCGVGNSPARRFCGECGAPLALACPACGFANEPDERFCGGCGTAYRYRSLTDEIAVAVLGDRRDYLPFGVLGGKPAAGADVVFRTGAGESRRPTLTWPRELPLGGEPADMVDIVSRYAAWLADETVVPLERVSA